MLFKNISVVTPVYNDWESFVILANDLSDLAVKFDLKINLIAVNDGSIKQLNNSELNSLNLNEIKILKLVCNLGHQRAIAIGLVEAYSYLDTDGVIVLDCDGEDKVVDIVKLIEKTNNNSIVVASRKSRSEGARFKLFYSLYKLIFKILVGKSIDFGNFCFIPKQRLGPLVFSAGIWNHLAAKIIQSRLPLKRKSCSRGKRYQGSSKMNFSSLLVHGLGAMSVFLDIILARLILILSSFIFFLIVTFIGVIILRLTTELGIPGQASTILGFIFIAVIQSILLVFVSVFLVLNLRSIKNIIPAIDGRNYILEINMIKGLNNYVK